MTTELDRQHHAHRRRAWLTWALMATAVVAFSLRMLRSGTDVATLVLVLLLVAGGAVAAMAVMAQGTARRHAAVVRGRPAARVLEVWGATGLHDALAAEGVSTAGVRRSSGTALSLAITDTGIELWRGTRAPVRVLRLPWSRVAHVTEGFGAIANDGAKPAVVVVTHRGNPLTLLPARDESGSLRTAGLDVVRRLVTDFDARRAAAEHRVAGESRGGASLAP